MLASCVVGRSLLSNAIRGNSKELTRTVLINSLSTSTGFKSGTTNTSKGDAGHTGAMLRFVKDRKAGAGGGSRPGVAPGSARPTNGPRGNRRSSSPETGARGPGGFKTRGGRGARSFPGAGAGEGSPAEGGEGAWRRSSGGRRGRGGEGAEESVFDSFAASNNDEAYQSDFDDFEDAFKTNTVEAEHEVRDPAELDLYEQRIADFMKEVVFRANSFEDPRPAPRRMKHVLKGGNVHMTMKEGEVGYEVVTGAELMLRHHTHWPMHGEGGRTQWLHHLEEFIRVADREEKEEEARLEALRLQGDFVDQDDFETFSDDEEL